MWFVDLFGAWFYSGVKERKLKTELVSIVLWLKMGELGNRNKIKIINYNYYWRLVNLQNNELGGLITLNKGKWWVAIDRLHDEKRYIIIKGTVNNVSTIKKNLSCMALHAISPEKMNFKSIIKCFKNESKSTILIVTVSISTVLYPWLCIDLSEHHYTAQISKFNHFFFIYNVK